jgi:hypothetical protein
LVNPADGAVEASDENMDEASDAPLEEDTVSYALLHLDGGGSDSEGSHPEWASKINSQAVLASDRTDEGGNDGDGSATSANDVGSVWDTSQWEGTMGWGDGHATQEEDHAVQTNVQGDNISEDWIWSNGESPDNTSNTSEPDDIDMEDPDISS